MEVVTVKDSIIYPLYFLLPAGSFLNKFVPYLRPPVAAAAAAVLVVGFWGDEAEEDVVSLSDSLSSSTFGCTGTSAGIWITGAGIGDGEMGISFSFSLSSSEDESSSDGSASELDSSFCCILVLLDSIDSSSDSSSADDVSADELLIGAVICGSLSAEAIVLVNCSRTC